MRKFYGKETMQNVVLESSSENNYNIFHILKEILNQSRTRARDPSVEGNEDAGIIQIRNASDWSLTPNRIHYPQFDDI